MRAICTTLTCRYRIDYAIRKALKGVLVKGGLVILRNDGFDGFGGSENKPGRNGGSKLAVSTVLTSPAHMMKQIIFRNCAFDGLCFCIDCLRDIC